MLPISFKVIWKAIVDALDVRDRGVGYVLNGLAPTAHGAASLQVDVAAGTFSANSTTAGTAYAGGNIALSAADGTNPRVDIVYFDSTGTLAKSNGTAAVIVPGNSGPVPVAWPAGSVPLAICFIPPTATDFTTGGYVLDARSFGQQATINAATQAGADMGAQINTAIAALPASGGKIVLPPGDFTGIATGVVFTKPIVLIGAGTGDGSATPPTRLNFNAGVTGITIQNGAKESRVQNLYLKSASVGAQNFDGVVIQGHGVVLDHVATENFGRYGFSIDTSSVGNANNSQLRECRAYLNRSHGFYLHGGNSNVVQLYGCDATQNAGRGFYDDAQTNAFYSPHAQGNTLGDYYENGSGNLYLLPYSEVGGGTNTALLDTGSSSIVWLGGINNPTITDSGTNNNVLTTGKWARLQAGGGSTAAAIFDRTAAFTDGQSVMLIDDDTATAQGDGGSIFFRGNLAGTGLVAASGIAARKTSATGTNQDWDLAIWNRRDGVGLQEVARFAAAGGLAILGGLTVGTALTKQMVSRYIFNGTLTKTNSAAGTFVDFAGSFTTTVTTLAGDQVGIRVQGMIEKLTAGNAEVVIDRSGTKLPTSGSSSLHLPAVGAWLPAAFEYWDSPSAGTYTYKPQLWTDDNNLASFGGGWGVQFIVEVWR